MSLKWHLGSDFFTPAVFLMLLAGVALAFLTRMGPARSGTHATHRRSRWQAIVPGVLDLAGGSPVRGCLALSLACVGPVALGIAYVTTTPKGFPSGIPNLSRTFPMPPTDFWTTFWAQPGATSYWAWVGVATLVAMFLHILAIRRARNINRPSSTNDATWSRQATQPAAAVTQGALPPARAPGDVA